MVCVFLFIDGWMAIIIIYQTTDDIYKMYRREIISDQQTQARDVMVIISQLTCL